MFMVEEKNVQYFPCSYCGELIEKPATSRYSKKNRKCTCFDCRTKHNREWQRNAKANRGS